MVNNKDNNSEPKINKKEINIDKPTSKGVKYGFIVLGLTALLIVIFLLAYNDGVQAILSIGKTPLN